MRHRLSRQQGRRRAGGRRRYRMLFQTPGRRPRRSTECANRALSARTAAGQLNSARRSRCRNTPPCRCACSAWASGSDLEHCRHASGCENWRLRATRSAPSSPGSQAGHGQQSSGCEPRDGPGAQASGSGAGPSRHRVTLSGRSAIRVPRRIGWSEGGRCSVQINLLSRDQRSQAAFVLVGVRRKPLAEIVDSLMQGTHPCLTGVPGSERRPWRRRSMKNWAALRACPVGRWLPRHGIHLKSDRVPGSRQVRSRRRCRRRRTAVLCHDRAGNTNERLALIIDDAERLLPDALAYLRLLVSVAPERMPQIVFIGDPSFLDIADQLTRLGSRT